jgi:hypothetical protein
MATGRLSSRIDDEVVQNVGADGSHGERALVVLPDDDHPIGCVGGGEGFADLR